MTYQSKTFRLNNLFRMAKERTPRIVDHVSDSSDEEIDEDDAFNSEDERKYGSSFNKNQGGKTADDDDDSSEASDDEDSDGIASGDDDEEDGDGGEYMLNLLNNLDSKENQEKNAKDATRKTLAHSTLVAESEFSSLHKSSNLTLDQLMNGITDTKGFIDVQKTMKDMTGDEYDEESRLKTTRAPVAKVVSDRIERKLQYQEQSEEVSLWTKAVKQNREAETLDFRPKDRIRITKDELVGKFEPSTDFEKEMAAALEEAGTAEEKDIKDSEGHDLFGEDENDDDDLGRNQLSAEELKKRHGELAKMRALMFYEEQKRHHMNKIKSKKYRKIRKKQKLRMKGAEDAEAVENDDDYAKDLEEKAEMERMKERMSLKHRNTSKWAKSVLRRGKNMDVETRRALSEQVRVGNELKRKMEGQYDADSDDDDDGDEELLKQARDILADAESDNLGEKRRGLFKLDFMKKGLEAQRERAKQEARELLRELEANVKSDESGNEESKSDKDEEEYASKVTAPSKEMNKILTKGKLVASSLEFGHSNPVSVTGGINLEVDSMPVSTEGTVDTATHVRLSNITNEEKRGRSKQSTATITSANELDSKVSNEEQNPWVRKDNVSYKAALGQDEKKHSRQPGISKRGVINIVDAVNVLTGDEGINDNAREAKVSEVLPETNSKISLLSQDELVKKAFATLSEQDIEEDFQKEKSAIMDREDYSKKEKDNKKLVTGWGSWAGEGAPPPNPPKKLPKKLAIPEKKVEKRPRQDDGKKNVIISAKRIKKAAKFQVENVPYPFTSREQYERAINGAVGPEWNISTAVKNFTRPDVVTRAGTMIRPISKKAKMKRAPLVKFK